MAIGSDNVRCPQRMPLENLTPLAHHCRVSKTTIFVTGAKGAKSAQIHPIAVDAKAISKSTSRYP
jgi:hypothetical protein